MSVFSIMLFLFLGLPYGIEGLEIDEKLTFRFLRLSSTKKTALLDRGLEDGLAVGDHAKFFVTKGVFARGVAIRVSPTRSVWSIYKILDPNVLVVDELLNLKITTPVKLTNDPSKSAFPDNVPLVQQAAPPPLPQGETDLPVSTFPVEEPQPEPEQLEMPQEEQQVEMPQEEEPEDLSGLLDSNDSTNMEESASDTLQNRSWELFGQFNYNLFEVTTDLGRDDSVDSAETSTGFSVGVEKYFSDMYHLLNNLSLAGIFRMGNQNSTFTSGIQSSLATLEYGGPSQLPYLGASFGHKSSHSLCRGRNGNG